MDKIKKLNLTTQKAARKFSRRTAIKRGAAPVFVKKIDFCRY